MDVHVAGGVGLGQHEEVVGGRFEPRSGEGRPESLVVVSERGGLLFEVDDLRVRFVVVVAGPDRKLRGRASGDVGEPDGDLGEDVAVDGVSGCEPVGDVFVVVESIGERSAAGLEGVDVVVSVAGGGCGCGCAFRLGSGCGFGCGSAGQVELGSSDGERQGVGFGLD